MDFLTKLYSNDNFGIIFFTSISILVLAFLIILFFGKKDQKERKLAETKILNSNDNNAKNIKEETGEFAFQEHTSSTDLKIPVQETPIIPVPPIVEPSIKEEPILNVTPIFEAKVEEPINEVPLPPQTDFDFDALAASISKELESIGVSEEEEETKIVEPEIQKVEEPVNPTPIIAPTIEPMINPSIFATQKVEEPISEIKVEEKMQEIKTDEIKPIGTPAQFSSVFVSKKNEEPKLESASFAEPIKEPEVVAEPPKMEMPKPIDLPKLNTEVDNKEEPIPNMNFGSLENDIPSYSRNEENRM